MPEQHKNLCYLTHDNRGVLILGPAGTHLKPGTAIAQGQIVSWRCGHEGCHSVVALDISADDSPVTTAAHVAVMINEMRRHELEDHLGQEPSLHPMLKHLESIVEVPIIRQGDKLP